MFSVLSDRKTERKVNFFSRHSISKYAKDNLCQLDLIHTKKSQFHPAVKTTREVGINNDAAAMKLLL